MIDDDAVEFNNCWSNLSVLLYFKKLSAFINRRPTFVWMGMTYSRVTEYTNKITVM